MNDAWVLSEKYNELRKTLNEKKCQLSGLLDMLGMNDGIPFESMLEIVLREVFEYINSLEDEDHRNLCKEYIILFFQINGGWQTALFIKISSKLKNKVLL